MPYRSWTNKDLENAVKNSKTKSEVIKKLGLKTNSSGNFQTIDHYIKILQLDCSHFKKNLFVKSKKEWDIKDILIENSPYTSTHSLKKKLIKFGLLSNSCYECNIDEWYGQKISLHLDHINGDRTNNRIENLRLLCPNCHSLTSTYCRGKKSKKEYKCLDCGIKVSRVNTRCQECAGLIRRGANQKINWPELTNLKSMAHELGFAETGKKLGVSDNAVKKRIIAQITRSVQPVKVGIFLDAPIGAKGESILPSVPSIGCIFSHSFEEFDKYKDIRVVSIGYSCISDCIQLLCREIYN